MKGNFSKTDLLKIFKEYGLISIGGLMYSFAWTSILIPAGVMGGGLNGIGLLIYYATGGTDGGIPLGVTFLVLNAVLVGVASLLISLKFGAKTIYAIGFISVAMAVMQQAVPGNVLGLADDKLLSAILGGALAAVWSIAGQPFGINPLWPACGLTLVSLFAISLASKSRVSESHLRYEEACRTLDAAEARARR